MIDQTRKKIITVSFVIAAGLAGLVAQVLLESTAAASGMVAKYYAQDWLKHGFPVSMGLILFLYLQFNSKVNLWSEEVVTEIGKIVWPSNKDTRIMTITCCVMLIISGVILWFFDSLSTSFVKMILSA